MNAQNTNAGASYSSKGGGQGSKSSGQQNEQSVTLGVGGPTSGEEGATPTHETMAETGGSGGPALTKNRDIEEAPLAPGSRQDAQAGSRQGEPADEPEGAGSDATAINRGYQDTRSRQAGPGATGLGAPETGGNQSEDDLAPPRRD